jgi:hypothetical protein
MEYSGSSRTMRCAYCNNNVPVPEEFWREVETKRTVKRWTTYLIIFLVITVVLPTCVGMFATLIGVAAPIVAMIVGFILQLFIRG